MLLYEDLKPGATFLCVTLSNFKSCKCNIYSIEILSCRIKKKTPPWVTRIRLSKQPLASFPRVTMTISVCAVSTFTGKSSVAQNLPDQENREKATNAGIKGRDDTNLL